MIYFNRYETKKIGNSIFGIWDRVIRARILRTQTHASTRELIWTLVPTFILLMIAVPSIELLYLMDVMISDGPIFNYKVIGHQWYWSYDYYGIFYKNALVSSNFSTVSTVFDSYMLSEEDVYLQHGLRLLEVDNPLVVPAYNNIHFLITSADVLHSWAVPSLGIKIDAIPGRINHICVLIKRVGTFYGQCSEICGINHGFMPIKLEAFDFVDYKI